MTALLRHRRTTRGGLRLTVQPNDGRVIEHYLVDPAELRRFAWAVLADLAPEEAQAAAAEDGLDLRQVSAARRLTPPRGAHNAERRPTGHRMALGSDQHMILAAMVEHGPQRTAAWGAHFKRCGGSVSDVFNKLIRHGHAERQSIGVRDGAHIAYAATDYGREVFAALGAYPAQETAA